MRSKAGEIGRAIKLAGPGGPLDFKNNKQKGKTSDGKDCPSGKYCLNTVMVFGKCVSDQVPGNLYFGLVGGSALGLKGSLTYSNEENKEKYGRPDSMDDVTAIRVGYSLSGPYSNENENEKLSTFDIFRYNNKLPFSHKVSDYEALVKNRFKANFLAAISTGKITGYSHCRACK